MAIDDPLSIEELPSKSPDTLIFRLTGPVTLRNLFDLQSKLRAVEPPLLTILDMSAVAYMDSAGMGAVINHYTRCQTKGRKLIVAGVSPRVLELFKMTRVDRVIPMAATIDEAESRT
jgi:anti-sigma B factor antagonist